MERVDKRALISFWELVEMLKTANKVLSAHDTVVSPQYAQSYVYTTKLIKKIVKYVSRPVLKGSYSLKSPDFTIFSVLKSSESLFQKQLHKI